MEELKVSNVIISKQGEDSSQYQNFLDIIKEKKINVMVVKEGDKFYIEDNVFFDILWPQEKLLNNNVLNNNAIVAKLHYNNFSMLFTGDIEKEAEDAISEENINLQADILKVAHHGSKTSTTVNFLNKVKPKIALIGVGKNNNFGHPSQETLNNLKDKKIAIYRTDLYGEIEIMVNNKGKVKLNKHIDRE